MDRNLLKCLITDVELNHQILKGSVSEFDAAGVLQLELPSFPFTYSVLSVCLSVCQ